MTALISVCPECKHVVNFHKIGFKSRPVENDIIDIGVECPFCQYWQHSYFMNDELTQRAVEVKNKPRKIRRKYQLDFRKFQKKMKARYGLSS